VSKLFITKTANEWMAEALTLPEPEKLYDELWLKGETAFLFGGTGTGKSLFAVQIGKEISKREPVLYFDFELSLVQFAKRYFTEDRDYLPFPDNFFRVEFARDVTYNQKQLVEEIQHNATKHKAKVLIIDNLTWILASNEKTIDAGNLMKEIAALKRNHGYSILIMSHTPKRDDTRPVTVNDMAGSMVLSNFIDSSFCIAKSAQDSSLRYVKQIKVRSAEIVYDYDSVKVFELYKSADGYLGLEDKGVGGENDHLRRPNEKQWQGKKEDCYQLLDQKMTYSQISEQLGIAKGTISKWAKQRNETFDDDLPF
jgi:predicted ATP-dependent serine protease